MPTFAPVTHVVFDMDGLLINTEDLYTELFTKICQEYDTQFTYAVKLKCMGRKPHIGIQIMIEDLKMTCTVEEIQKKVAEYSPDIFAKADLLPGAERLIRHLKKHGVPMVICTGSSTPSYDNKVRNKPHVQELFGLMEHVLCCGSSDEVKTGKPAPDAYLVAARKFKNGPVDPKNCLAFEDSPLGVDSAVDAGMQCVMVPDRRLPEEFRKRATTVIYDLNELKLEEFGLPAYEA